MTDARRSHAGRALGRLLLLLAVAVAALPAGATRAAVTTDGSTTAAKRVVQLVTHVPARALDAVGTGSFTRFSSATRLTGSPLSVSGRPEVLTVNMAWCPHCVANSWPLAIALSRFGTLSGLRQIDSGTWYGDTFKANPSFPHTRGLSFLTARLRSSRLAFAGRVLQDLQGASLQQLTTEERGAISAFDPRGIIPSVDVGGVYGFVGTGDATALLAGRSWMQIAEQLRSPTTAIARSIDGLANVFTAAICVATRNRPATVCSSAGVKAARVKLPKVVTPPSTIVPS